MKYCWRCKTTKERDEFHKNKSKDDGLASECRSCVREKDRLRRVNDGERLRARSHAYYEKHKRELLAKCREYREAHKVEIRAMKRRWADRNRAHIRAKKAAYRAEHREAIRRAHKAWRERRAEHHRERSATWRKRHVEQVRSYRRDWARRNPDYIRDVRRSAEARRRARKKGTRVAYFSTRSIAIRDNWTCHICGGAVTEDEVTIDHLIPLSLGGPHVAWNVALAHGRCNSQRGAGRMPAQLRLDV